MTGPCNFLFFLMHLLAKFHKPLSFRLVIALSRAFSQIPSLYIRQSQSSFFHTFFHGSKAKCLHKKLDVFRIMAITILRNLFITLVPQAKRMC